MTAQEFRDAQQDAIEIAIMLSELKKKDPQISERLKSVSYTHLDVYKRQR